LKSGANYPIATSDTLKAYAVTGTATSATDSIKVQIFQRPPTVGLASGVYPVAKLVSLTSPTTGASIYYTTTGSDPTTSSALYTGAITVGSSKTIKAIAVMAGVANSVITNATY